MALDGTADWINRQTDDLLFCRVTQMGLLKLLSKSGHHGR
jgi:hypothetical protein